MIHFSNRGEGYFFRIAQFRNFEKFINFTLANVEKTDHAVIKKLQEEKQILVRAFNKQRQKSQVTHNF